jgi:hypothetical protein
MNECVEKGRFANVQGIALEIALEVRRAMSKHGPMLSRHDGYAVILEELDELWDEVKEKHPDVGKMRQEAIQVAAMAIRFIHDVIGALDAKAAQ